MSPNIKRLTSVPYSNDDIDDDDDDEEEHDDVNIINKNKSSDEAFVNGDDDDGDDDDEKDKEKDNDNDNWIVCPASAKSHRTINPIRAIVDPIVAEQQQAQSAAAAASSSTMKEQQRKDDDDGNNKKKEFISLALGDPTANGNLPPCNVAIESIMNVLLSSSSNNNNNAATGYVNACGTERARHAIAQYHSYDNVGLKVTPDNVIIANGCSGALELALTSLLDTDSVLLVPRPGFPLYEVIAKSHGAKVEHYNLLPNSNWECDLQHIQSIILKYRNNNNNHNNTIIRGIVINNPSNPTGSVYSEQHLIDIISIANKNKLPIVADEIYGDLTYNDNKFYPLSFISAKYFHQHVPIITTSGLGKQFLLPGWRIGWIVFHDSIHKSLREVEAGTKRLAQVILGASNLCQQVIPDLLVLPSSVTYDRVSKWKYTLQQTLQDQALVLCNNISSSSSCTPGLSIIQPQGAMYAMIRINLSMFTTTTTTTTSTDNKTTTRMIQNDVDFAKLLLKEENVFVLPGSAFGMDTRSIQHVSDGSVLMSSYAFFRVVFCSPKNVLLEATKRISNFCKRHTTCTTTITTTSTTTTEATTSMTPQTTLSD